MGKIGLEDSLEDVLYKVGEGNPGAINVLMGLIKDEASIDPQSMMAPLATILKLDDWDIRGSKVWVLYKDVCKSNIRNMVVLVRAWQLGFINHELIVSAADGAEFSFDLESLDAKVCERLDQFQRPVVVT